MIKEPRCTLHPRVLRLSCNNLATDLPQEPDILHLKALQAMVLLQWLRDMEPQPQDTEHHHQLQGMDLLLLLQDMAPHHPKWVPKCRH